MPSSRDLLALPVLALLSEQPRHPYEIERLIRERRKDFAAGKRRGLYHAVERLVRDGSIEPVETNREGKRPERTVYRITDEGREELEGWLRELLQNPIAEYPVFTAAVGFLGYLSSDTVVQALRARAVALEAEIAGVNAVLPALQEQLHLPRLVLLEHEYTRALRQAELDWISAIVADIRTGRLAWDKDALYRLFDTHHAGADAPAASAGPGQESATADGERESTRG
ncbi:MAG TPA: PadR family transcriptional regulator [Chloroflexota bacterium]|jgi:DNA-binding PadR family transcriptional regulator|nr:PadR family transcriptional regulator [Chloroflexota bacterium]